MVQPSRQVSEKQGHNVCIGVGLRQAAPDLAISINFQEQGDPGLHLLLAKGTRRIGRDPCPTQVPGLVEPRLVHVDDPRLPLEQGQESE